MAQVKKLSVATVYGKIKLSDLASKRSITVMRVIGVAVGVKTGISTFGEWKSLVGKFRATNPATGEMSEAAALFLPDVALIPLEVALSTGAAAVEFAIDVGVKYVAEDEGHRAGGSPYEYFFEPLMAASQDDPLERLAAKLSAQTPIALAAPANTAPVGKPDEPIDGSRNKRSR